MLCCCFSFKLNTKAFIRIIYYNICKLFLKIFLRKFIIWERKGNFKLAKVLNLYPTHNHMIRKSNQNLTFQTISKLTKYREREREKKHSLLSLQPMSTMKSTQNIVKPVKRGHFSVCK